MGEFTKCSSESKSIIKSKDSKGSISLGKKIIKLIGMIEQVGKSMFSES